jgi:long-chain fatty acid transport protein
MTIFATLRPRSLGAALGAALCGLGAIAAAGPAAAGGFAVREQSTTFLGSAFAGSAAGGGDISGIFWNPAAGALPGCNTSSSYSLILGRSDETASSGLFVTGTPPIASGLSPTSTDVGTDTLVPASYLTCQLSDKLFVGLALNSQFGLLTKPDDLGWAGSPIAVTSKVFSANLNPTLAYKLTPSLTVGVGLQVEYLKIRLNHASFPPLVGARNYEADGWGVGATAGILWQPMSGTTLGLGFRSAVGLDVDGPFWRDAGLVPGATATAEAGITLPEQVTLSFRQALTPGWTLLGTVEWMNWSRLGNVTAVGAGCGPSGVCEVLNLNYRDGWLFALGAEHAYSPLLTLRAGVAYEISPIKDGTRDILLPDSNRVFLSLGASYKYSQHITLDLAYAHIFFEGAPFCIASPTTGSTHCAASTLPSDILLRGDSETSVDILAVGLRYRF